MCPVCLATAAIIAGSAAGTGGLTALVAHTIRRKTPDNAIPANPKKEESHGHQPDNSPAPQDRLSL